MNKESSTIERYDLPWHEPLQIVGALAGEPCALLYSCRKSSYSGRYSIFATGLEKRISGDDFSLLEPELSNNLPKFLNCWFGYFGYGLRHRLENVPKNLPASISLPDLWFAKFSTIYLFDHEKKKLECWAHSKPELKISAIPEAKIPKISSLESNMTKEIYLNGVYKLLEHIHAGNLYQANLTRKFFGEFKAPPSAFTLFRRLCEASPSGYSAYFNIGDTHILSSSPERFLQMDEKGLINTRPIKGSAPRSDNVAQDEALRQALLGSSKERAENLMIVDLLRNDLSRAAKNASVTLDSLYDLSSYKTVHHLSSSISAELSAEKTALDLIKSTFPPGSMTGAPKISAMQICSELEQMERGIYSGALGYVGGDGSLDLSVVIRTLILYENCFEFQVGGGIVADSDPEAEWEETIVKARGICSTIGLDPSLLAQL